MKFIFKNIFIYFLKKAYDIIKFKSICNKYIDNITDIIISKADISYQL